MQNVAEYIVRTLAAMEVECMFGYPGQSNLQLLRAARSEGMRYVQTADERERRICGGGIYRSPPVRQPSCAHRRALRPRIF